MTAVDVGRAGEAVIVKELQAKGYTIIRWDTQSPGSSDIEANTGTHLLVQVKSAVSPNVAASLSSDEERNIKSRATRIGAQAWEARVQLDSGLRNGTVSWRHLV